jgi:enamine deaminase RidA (YjgF/YER057c/UK114 family)
VAARYNARRIAGKEDAMPKVIKPAGFAAPLGLYSPGMAVAAGEIVAVAGMTGIDGAGRIAGADVGAQTKQALANVKAVVEAAGCKMRDVIRLQTFLTRADDVAGFMKARQEVFAVEFPGGPYPTNTLLVVSALAQPELRVEIEAMAVKPLRAAARRRVNPAKRAGRGRRR